MCGLIMAQDFTGKPVNGFIMQQFEKQKHRGTEGFGVFDMLNHKLVKATKERKIMGWLKNHDQPALMFHHRYPTSTRNRKSACHPFSTRDFFKTNYVLIHNGHIANSALLKQDHEELGIKYQSYQNHDKKFNDSEALLWDVALYLEGKQDKLKAYGNIAFICLAIPKDKRKPTKLYFARNNNPLVMNLSKKRITLASEGEGKYVLSNMLYTFNYKTHQLSTKDLVVPESYWDTEERPHTHVPGPYASDYNWESRWGNTWEEELERESAAVSISGAMLGFRILPPQEDFSWSSLYPKITDELTYQASDGREVDIKSLVVERIDGYLETVDGVYMDAYSLLNYDIHTLNRQLATDRLQGLSDDEDLVLEIDLLMAAREAFDTNLNWNEPESADPRYAFATAIYQPA